MKTLFRISVIVVIAGCAYYMFKPEPQCQKTCQKTCTKKVECDKVLTPSFIESMGDSLNMEDLVCVACPCDTFCVTTVDMSDDIASCCDGLCLAKGCNNVNELLDKLSEVEVKQCQH